MRTIAFAFVVACGCSNTTPSNEQVGGNSLKQAPSPKPPRSPMIEAPTATADPEDPPTKRGPSMESVRVQAAVPGLAVHVDAVGEISWKLTVRNDTNDNMQLLWDESSFVTGGGKSWGRLIPSDIRRMDLRSARPPLPLAPHSTTTQTVLPEANALAEGIGYDFRGDLSEGRLYVAVTTTSGKRTWAAVISESNKDPLGWWCFKSDDSDLCLREETKCVTQAKKTACRRAESAWCLVSSRGYPLCFGEEKQCRALDSESTIGCAERK